LLLSYEQSHSYLLFFAPGRHFRDLAMHSSIRQTKASEGGGNSTMSNSESEDQATPSSSIV
jgi:hypothetical protein